MSATSDYMKHAEARLLQFQRDVADLQRQLAEARDKALEEAAVIAERHHTGWGAADAIRAAQGE